MKATIGALLLVAIILAIIFIPWFAFWCVEVLFNHHIEFTLKNWSASIILLAIIAGPSRG